jgi:hypothetical protein
MADLTRLSFRRVSRVLGTVGLASVAFALVARAMKPPAKRSSGPARIVPLRVVPSCASDSHLGAVERDFDWASAGRY